MSEFKTILGVMAGGALGAAARYLISGWVFRATGGSFPWGTMMVNLTGCLVLGFCAGLRLEGRSAVWALLMISFTAGFLGAYTTFSTFAVDAIRLWERQGSLPALGYVLGSVLLGICAAVLGVWAARQWA